MSVERVRGRSVTEALSLARAQLGEDAEILEVCDHPEGVELVCKRGAQRPPPKSAITPATASPVPPDLQGDVQALRREIAALRTRLTAPRSKPSPLAERMRAQRVAPALGRLALRAAGDSVGASAFTRAEHALALHLIGAVPPTPPLAPCRLALVGPTGVGKTTTAARLAKRAVSRGMSVALIGCDRHRAGGDEQLRVLANRVGVPLTVAGGGSSLRRALDAFADRDLVIVDTAGAGPGAPQRVTELSKLFDAAPEITLHLVLAAPTGPAAQESAWRLLAPLGLGGLSFTKLDETPALGPLLSVLPRLHLPLAWLGSGHDLDSLQAASVRTVVRRVLGVEAKPAWGIRPLTLSAPRTAGSAALMNATQRPRRVHV